MPDIHRRAIDGADVDTAGARGRVVVIDFFSKHCEPCRRTLPELEALHRAEPEVLVIGVAEDDAVSDVQEMVSTHQLTFKVVQDQGNVLSGRYRVRDIPTTFVARPGGAIHWVGGADVTQDALSRAIAEARRTK
jgi:cytochrome c-type biogenesis protein